MAKRGRPKTTETPIWEKKYYKLSTIADNRALRKTREERLIKAYNQVHELVYDIPMDTKTTNEVRKLLYLE